MRTARERFGQATAALLALAVFGSVLSPVGVVAAAPSITITQSAAGATATPGDTITVEATVDYSGVNAPAIDATLPSGWTVTSHTDDGGTYGPPQPAWIWVEGDGDGVSGSHTVTYTVQVPGDASPGDYTIAGEGSAKNPTDGSDVVATDDLTVTVEDPGQNAPPTVDAGQDRTVAEGATVTLDASSTDPDVDDIVTYTWTQTAGEPDVTLSSQYTEAPTFTAPAVGIETTLAFEVTATDGNGGTDTDTVDVTVQPTNDAPVADAGPDRSITAGDTVELDGRGSSDPNGDTLSYTWERVAGPAVGTLSADGTATPTFAARSTVPGASSVVMELTVSDEDGSTDTDITNVTVRTADGSAPRVDDTTTTARLVPTNGETTVGDATSIDIVVTGADRGVGAYAATVTLDDPTAAAITDAELHGEPGLQDVTVAADGSNVSIRAALMNATDAGDVTVATITVRGDNAGELALDLTVSALGDPTGAPYAVRTGGTSLSVVTHDVGSPVQDGGESATGRTSGNTGGSDSTSTAGTGSTTAPAGPAADSSGDRSAASDAGGESPSVPDADGDGDATAATRFGASLNTDALRALGGAGGPAVAATVVAALLIGAGLRRWR
jgi:hypothetical protein